MEHEIASGKLSGYLLNLAHPDGGPKARFLLARGFVRERPEELGAALERHALEAAEITRAWHPGGAKVVFMCAVAAADGTRPCIHSVWIEDTAASRRRLVTAYPANPLKAPAP